MLQLRDYQERSLEILAAYLTAAGEQGAKVPFVLQTERPYREVTQLPALPYVCLRVPTGGGKTFMACHAVGIAGEKFLCVEHPSVLWLAPSNAIVNQTLAALKDRKHPYRQELDRRFGGNVEVMTLKESLYVQRAVLDGATTIIVSTLAALRVEDTEGRKIYETAGALSHHFSGLNAEQEALLEKDADGIFPHSLANVLRLRRPLIIMDEAHNARTKLSFDTLARFAPSAIIELTATPETRHKPESGQFASNVLHHVSARELKHAEMIKLPIRLQTPGGDWKLAVGEAVEQQRGLEQIALEEEKTGQDYLRPIVLLQAQPRSKQRETLTVDVVKACLLDDFKVPEEQIAVATGETREIDGVDLSGRDCEIRFIITVAALKEGWDCPFAYILCTVSEIGTARAVEQILGRILRLPGAKRRPHEELNRAYAYVASPRFHETAKSLQDALVENGFQAMEARDFVVPDQQRELPGFERDSLFATITEPVSEEPNLSSVEPDLKRRVTYDKPSGCLTVTGGIGKAEKASLQDCFRQKSDKAAVERIFARFHGHAPASGAETPRPPFHVPQLAIRTAGQLELFEDTHLLEVPWDLAKCDATLSEADFPTERAAGMAGEIDVTEDGNVQMVGFVSQLHRQLTMLTFEHGWTAAALANWLDRKIPHPDIVRSQSSLFMHNILSGLMESRKVSVDQLAREKFRLARAVEKSIKGHRETHAKKAFNYLLFEGDVEVTVDPELYFTFDDANYNPNRYFEGSPPFRKHYFTHVGGLKSSGEEYDCARFIDGLDEVIYWVRNIERRPYSSFWLQTSTDRFYPDFVALLKDSRVLVVESKGEHLWSNDDSKEKRAVGDLWAERSGGHCLFVMPKGSDWAAIKAVSAAARSS